MIYQYFENTVKGIEESIANSAEKPSARKIYALNIAKLGNSL